MVDFPDPDNPVSQMVAPASPSFAHRSSRESSASCQTTLGLLTSSSQNHAGAGGGVGGFVDEDEAAGGAAAAVLVVEQRLGAAQADPADLVQREPVGGVVAVQGVDVQPVLQVAH